METYWDIQDCEGSKKRLLTELSKVHLNYHLCSGCKEMKPIVAFAVRKTEAKTLFQVSPVCAACHKNNTISPAHFHYPQTLMRGLEALSIRPQGESQGVG